MLCGPKACSQVIIWSTKLSVFTVLVCLQNQYMAVFLPQSSILAKTVFLAFCILGQNLFSLVQNINQPTNETLKRKVHKY